MIVALLFVARVNPEPMRSIVIDGSFDDWLNVPKRSDPYQPTMDAPNVTDGFPPLPDVHDTTGSDLCSNHSYRWNPVVDVMQIAVAHDETYIYAYFKGVGTIGKTTVGEKGQGAGRLYIQVNIDVDNNYTTGYNGGDGGYFPNQQGVDVAFEIEMFNGSFNTGHVVLHAAQATNADRNRSMEDQKQGKCTLANQIFPYKGYTEWVYYDKDHPPTASEVARCGSTSWTHGLYTLPDGAQICFISDECNGPYQGAFKYAFSANGDELELGAPYASFLTRSDTNQPVLQPGMTVSIQGSFETSGQLSIPPDWASDATLPFAYYLGPRPSPTLPPSPLVSALGAGTVSILAPLLLGAALGAVLSGLITFCVLRSNLFRAAMPVERL